MRRHGSVLLWLCRSSLSPMLLLLLAAGAAQAGWFLAGMGRAASLETLLAGGALAVPAALCLLLLCALLAGVGCDRGAAKCGFTLRRLRVTERAVLLWQWAYNTACLLLLWAFELLLAFGLCVLFTARQEPSLVSGQTVFLAFLRSPLLHGLLPLGEWSLWARNALLAVTLGGACALLPYKQRRGRLGWETPAAATLALFSFPCGVGRWESVVLTLLLSACLLLQIGVAVWGREGVSGDEKTL